MPLEPIDLADIPVDVPLPWPLCDKDGRVLFYDGEAVSEQRLEMLAKLLEGGLFRRESGNPPPPKTVPQPEASAAPAEGAEKPVAEKTPGRPRPDTAPEELPFPPPGIRPQVGDRLQIVPVGRGGRVPFLAHFVGYLKDVSLLVTVPVHDGRPAYLEEGESVEVKMLTGNHILLMQTLVLQNCTAPCAYLHLEYPRRVMRHRLRRSPWVKADFTATVQGAEGGESPVHVTNLSGTGANFHAPTVLAQEGEILRVNFTPRVDELAGHLSLEAVVRHLAQPRPEPGKKVPVEYGVEFVNFGPAEALWLNAVVFERIAKGFLA